MSRKFNPLLVAALALIAIGAFASVAHASVEFHCSVSPCRWRALRDGEGKTTHQVFVIENTAKTESLSVTCEYFRGEARSEGKNTSELVVEWPNTALRPKHSREAFSNCLAAGGGMEVEMNTCKLILKPVGSGALSCPEATKVEMRLASGCTFTLGPQTLSGLSYHTIGTAPHREITSSVNVTGIAITADGTTASCHINPAQTLVAAYTTGNAIVRAEADNLTEKEEVSEGKTAEQADGWFE
jgi:hypothetical protein